MESLQVRTGQISLRILDDSGELRGIFKFNPEDIESAKRVLSVQSELETKEEEYQKRIEETTTADERIQLMDEFVTYLNGLIDKCFGEGSSEILFGKAKTLSMYSDFFDGIAPYYKKASNTRTAKYKKKSGK